MKDVDEDSDVNADAAGAKGRWGRRKLLKGVGGIGILGGFGGSIIVLSESSGKRTGDRAPNQTTISDGHPNASTTETIQRRVDAASSGDVVSLEGGTYDLSDTIRVSTCGSAGCPVRIEGSETETTVLEYPTEDWRSDVDSTYDGIHLETSHLTLRNLQITGAPRNGIKIVGEDTHGIALENVEIHNCGKDGIRIQDGVHDLEVRNSYFHDNGYAGDEPGSGDGMAMTSSTGTPVSNGLVEHCDFLYNSDDGLDLFGAEDIDVVRCRTARNGYYESGNPTGGNGNGFKLGGSAADTTGGGAVVGNVAVGNASHGFNWNAANRELHVFQNTAYENDEIGFRFREDIHVLRNNLAAQNGEEAVLSDSDDDHNSWNVDIDDPEFASTNHRDSNFLFLSAESPAIDRGTPLDIEWPTKGSAPDLGAYERGAEERVGSRLFETS